jgi:hypothetical protein
VGHGWGTQLRAGFVIGAGLLLALAATIGPAPAPTADPGASLAVRLPDAVRTIVLVLLGVSVLLLLAVQRPRRPTEDDPLPTRIPQRRSAWAAVLLPLPFLLLAVTAWYLTREPWSSPESNPLERAFTTIAGLLDLLARARKAPTSVPAFDLTIATLALVASLALFALMLLVAMAGPLEKWLARRPTVDARPAAVDAAEGVDDLRAEPDARVAVIRAYRQFERAAAAARAPRAPWQTPAEFMRTTFVQLALPVAPVERLTGLFELARFSDRQLDPGARDTACDCLDQITTALDAGARPDGRDA